MTPSPSHRSSLRLGPVLVDVPAGADTELYGILGSPVAASLSPPMQQAAFDAHGSRACYLRFDVPPVHLESFVQDARRVGDRLRGLNVTAPHKTAILAFVDALDDISALAGAVNTVVIDAAGRWRGHNTDVDGLRELWRRAGAVPSRRPLVVVGAGGLARAAVVAGLRDEVAEIRILNRTPSRAQALLQDVLSRWTGPVPRLRCAAWNEGRNWLRDAAVLVQATPIGIAGDAAPVDLELAGADLFVLESLYAAPTALWRQATRLGLRRADGLALLLAQGVASWRLWMQAEPDREAMRRTLPRPH